MNFLQILLFLVMTFMGSLGALFLKQAMGRMDRLNVTELLKAPLVYLGGGLYVASALLNIFLLRFVDYSVLYPMTAVTYVWTIVLSHFALKELVDTKKVVAIAFILLGVGLLGV
jgi:EamA-like transporter family.